MPTLSEQYPSSETVRILRSALPYIGSSMRQSFHLALKCLELQDLIHAPKPTMLTRGESNDSEKNTTHTPIQQRVNMLKSIRGACSPEHTQYVDTMLQTFRMQAMIQSMPAFSASNDSVSGPVIPFLRPNTSTTDQKSNDELEHSLKAMLTPQQQTMFQTFSSMLKSSGGGINE